MDSSIASLAFWIGSILMVLLLLAAVLWLHRTASRMLESQRGLLASSMTSSTDSVEAMTSAMQATVTTLFDRLLAESARSQLQSLQVMEGSSKASTAAISSMVATNQAILSDALKLLGTKDPIAFQQIGGGSPVGEVVGAPGTDVPFRPYTAADEEAIRQQMLAEAAGDRLVQLAMSGGPGGGVAGYPFDPAAGGPLPGDGSAFLAGSGIGSAQ
jgi:hypothetical protein